MEPTVCAPPSCSGGADREGLTAEQSARRRWMGVLARTPRLALEAVWSGLGDVPRYAFLRSSEVGSALVRARIGGSGDRFNVGEMTITRCAVRLESGTVGLAYVAGRDGRQAELAALFDALLQDPSYRKRLEDALIEPQATAQEEAKRHRAGKTAATRVDFFTMVRGED